MRIRWTEPALKDLLHIGDHTEVRFGSERARQTTFQIHETVAMLASFPGMGRIGRRSGTSEQVIDGLPFIAIYRVKTMWLKFCAFCMAHRDGREITVGVLPLWICLNDIRRLEER